MLKIGKKLYKQAIWFPYIMDIFGWETKLVNVGMEGEVEQHSNRK